MKIGVKQGEPLSPLLFNLAIDPLLGVLEGLGRGFRYGEENIRVIAYADDLGLLSDSWSGMARNIGILEAFYELSGLRVNPAKCQGFLIAKGKRTVGGINDCPEWKLCGEGISMVAAGEYIKYLGVEISPWKGIKQPDLLTEVLAMVASIADAPLKPTQKVEVLCEYAVPRLMYKAVHCSAKQTNLRSADMEIRRTIKRWLHLSPGTTNGISNSRKADGGLKLNRMNRHNHVCALLAAVGERKGWRVMREKHITMSTGRMGVPDLEFVKGPDLLVVDVTVRFDGREEKAV